MREQLVAGDSIDEEVEAFDSAGNEYSGDDGWAATFYFIPRGGGAGAAFNMICTWTGDAFRYQASAPTTANWIPDFYSWALVVNKVGLQVTIEEGTAQVTPNRTTVATFDNRTQAQKAVDDCKVAYASFNATGGRVKSYSIAGRAMEFESAEGISSLLSFWNTELWHEKRRNAIASGKPDPGRIHLVLNR